MQVSQPPKILLVEDELASAEAVGFLLQMNGFEVAAAANGREALDCLDEIRPDLVLSDIMMPVMDGLELVQKIRENPEHRDLPVILMSAAHHMLAAGTPASAVLRKPLDFPRLLTAIRRLLGLPLSD
jgi:CheY-like chemotaxis protein